jgi:hypothetical protein
MPAPTLTDLYQFEAQFGAAVVGILSNAGYTDIYVRGTNDAVHDTGIMTWCDVSQADTECMGRISSGPLAGRPEFVGYSCTLAIMRVVPRQENSEIPLTTSLVYEAGKIRSLFIRAALPFNSENLPYINVDAVTPLATQWGISDSGNLDTCTLSWNISFSINPTAWPTD